MAFRPKTATLKIGENLWFQDEHTGLHSRHHLQVNLIETHTCVSAHVFKDTKQIFLSITNSQCPFQQSKFGIVAVLIYFVAFKWLQNKCPGSETKFAVITQYFRQRTWAWMFELQHSVTPRAFMIWGNRDILFEWSLYPNFKIKKLIVTSSSPNIFHQELIFQNSKVLAFLK